MPILEYTALFGFRYVLPTYTYRCTCSETHLGRKVLRGVETERKQTRTEFEFRFKTVLVETDNPDKKENEGSEKERLLFTMELFVPNTA